MEHFIRTAFWIVTLSVTLSGCHPLYFLQMNYDIELMKEITCVEGSQFYSPVDVEPECITAALLCVHGELKTIIDECEDINKRTLQANETLSHKIEGRGGTNQEVPKGCECEVWPQKPLGKFLEDYRTLLQQEKALAS
ncbi:uncharacterized protein il2 [Menidia menidia]